MPGNKTPDAVKLAIVRKNDAQAIVRALPLRQIIYLIAGEINSDMPGAANLRCHDRALEYLLCRTGLLG